MFSRFSAGRKGPGPAARHQPPARPQSRCTHCSSLSRRSAATEYAGSAPDAGILYILYCIYSSQSVVLAPCQANLRQRSVKTQSHCFILLYTVCSLLSTNHTKYYVFYFIDRHLLFLCPRWTSFPSSPTGSPLLLLLLTTGPGTKMSGSQDPPDLLDPRAPTAPTAPTSPQALRPQPDPSTVGPPPPKAPRTWDSLYADTGVPTPTLEAPHRPCFTTQGSHPLR